MTHEVLIAGFGGQGILFAGKLLAYTAMLEGKYVSWLPSYGPEMRGGTANCSVIVSDEPVSSPIIVNPTTLIVMNLPSLEKFEKAVVKGGNILIDSSLIPEEFSRDDTKNIAIPSTKLADDMKVGKLANMIILGKALKETGIFPLETVLKALEKLVPAKKAELLESNKKALEAGYHFA